MIQLKQITSLQLSKDFARDGAKLIRKGSQLIAIFPKGNNYFVSRHSRLSRYPSVFLLDGEKVQFALKIK